MKHNTKDISGERFGRLVVLRQGDLRVYKNGLKRGTWVCLCDCGKEHTTTGVALRRGGSQSCGCLRRERARAAATRHGEAGVKGKKGTPRYEMWRCAKERARKRGIPFALDLEDVVIPDVCPALGIPLVVNGEGAPGDDSPSLDRIIPSKGYVKGNVQVISQKANRIKSDATPAEVLKVAKFMETAR